MKISAIRQIKCPMCKQNIEAGDLVFHCDSEIRNYTCKQSTKKLLKLCKGLKPINVR